MASIRRLVTARRTIVHVQVESLQLPGTDRRDLAARCEAAVRGDTGRRGTRARAGRLTGDSGRPVACGRLCMERLDDPRAMSPVYLDHAATTPMHPAAIEAMTAVLATVGNASSLHGTGRVARRRMEESRETLAKLLGARPSEVDLHRGRHRERQPGRQGHLLGAPRRRTPPSAHHHHRGRTSCGARLGRMAGRTRRRRGDLAADRIRRLGRARRAAGGPAGARRCRPGVGDVGQQRGRHHHAARRNWPRWPPNSTFRCTATRCRRSVRYRSTSPRAGCRR